MSAEESIVWGQFLAKFNKLYDRFDYDLRVGKGVEVAENIPEKFRQDYVALTQKRIDAVGYKNNRAHIFEVKTRATLSPIGQLIGYKSLFISTFPNIPVDTINLVCSQLLPEDALIYKAQNIKTFIMPVSLSMLP